MDSSILKQIAKFLQEQKKHKRWLAVVTCLAVVVSLGTVAALKLRGQAMTHKEKVLNCGLQVHQHTEDCYDEQQNLICGLADYVVHTHNDDCYDANGNLVCTLPEIAAHQHTEECWQEQPKLVCDKEETAGHQHTDECYVREQGDLICGYDTEAAETGEAHTHTDECYEWNEVLDCGMEEGEGGHTHGEECYETEQVLTCGQLELHTHTPDCFDENGALTCTIPVLEEHIHGEECFEIIELTPEEVAALNTADTQTPDTETVADTEEQDVASAEEPANAEESAEELLQKAYEDDSIKVVAQYTAAANIPEEAELIVKQITAESDPEHYAEREAAMQEEVGSTDTPMNALLNIGFYVEGQEIEPEDKVTITIQFLNDEGIAAGDPITVMHFAEDGTEVLNGSNVDEDGSTTFETNSFSDYGIMAVQAADDGGIPVLVSDGTEWVEVGSIVGIVFTDIYGFQPLELWTGATNPSYNGVIEPLLAGYGYQNENIARDSVWIGYSTDNIYLNAYRVDWQDDTTKFWKLDNAFFDGSTGTLKTNVKAIYYLPNNTEELNNKLITDLDLEQYKAGASTGTLKSKIVLNPSNNESAESTARKYYTSGSGSKGRVSVNIPETQLTEEGMATIQLPSDTDLGKGFDVNGDETNETIPNEDTGYYKLVGWYNIADKKYYDVSNGAKTVTVDMRLNNVFYADWIADSYDNYTNSLDTLKNVGGLVSTENTNGFIITKLFDYNELFNIYSASLTQSGTDAETWVDSYQLNPNNGPENSAGSDVSRSMRFIYGQGYALYAMGIVNDDWNKSSSKLMVDQWGIQSLNSQPLPLLFQEDSEALGVHYVGRGNYLYQKNDDGYYEFDSAQTGGALYEQSQERFYVYEKGNAIDGKKQFLPFNPLLQSPSGHTNDYVAQNFGGDAPAINYHFGMSSEVSFYLPEEVKSGSTAEGNVVDDNPMIFEFSGDDDVWVFIDGDLVLDMGGIHGAMSGSINFQTGEVIANNAKQKSLNLSKGSHQMTIYYMERGAGLSNCKIKFNIIPRYMIDPQKADTVTVKKEWKNADTVTKPDVKVGLYKRTTNADGTVQDEAVTGRSDQEVTLNERNEWKYEWVGLPKLEDTNVEYVVKEEPIAPFVSASEVEPGQDYNYWAGTDDLEIKDADIISDDGYKKIVILNEDCSAALNASLETTKITFQKEDDDTDNRNGLVFCEASDGVNGSSLSSDLPKEIQWTVIPVKEGYKLKSSSNSYLKVSDGNKKELTDEKSASVFSLDDFGESGRSTGQKLTEGNTADLYVGDSSCIYIYSLQDVSSKVSAYTITNTYVPDVTIQKADSIEKEKLLSGAVFELYYEDDTISGKYHYYNYSTEGVGSWMDASSEDGIGTFTMPETGLQLKQIQDGTYYLVETQPPANYEAVEGGLKVKIEIEEAKIKSAVRVNDSSEEESELLEITGNNLTLKVYNEKTIVGAEVRFIKTKISDSDPKTNRLAGAVFSIYREATIEDGDWDGDNWKGETVKVDGKDIPVIAIDESTASYTSGEDGIIYTGTLLPGNYYLKETTPPDGYNLLENIITVTVTDSADGANIKVGGIATTTSRVAYNEDKRLYEISIPNSTGYKLPDTGGIGTHPFTTWGAALLIASVFLLYGCSMRHKLRERRSKN